MQWYCRLVIKNSVLDSKVCSWDSLMWETASPRTHKPKIVNESLPSDYATFNQSKSILFFNIGLLLERGKQQNVFTLCFYC